MSKVQSFMKFAFLRLIELFYLYVFTYPTRDKCCVTEKKLKDSVGSQRTLLKKTSTLACQELLLHSLQKATRNDSQVLAVTGQFPTGGRTPHPNNG